MRYFQWGIFVVVFLFPTTRIHSAPYPCGTVAIVMMYAKPLAEKIGNGQAIDLEMSTAPIELLEKVIQYNNAAIEADTLVEVESYDYQRYLEAKKNGKQTTFRINNRMVVEVFQTRKKAIAEDDFSTDVMYDASVVKFTPSTTSAELININNKISEVIRTLAILRSSDPTSYHLLTTSVRQELTVEVQAVRLRRMEKVREELRIAIIPYLTRKAAADKVALFEAEVANSQAEIMGMVKALNPKARNSLEVLLSSLRLNREFNSKPISEKVLQAEISRLVDAKDLIEPDLAGFDFGGSEIRLYSAYNSSRYLNALGAVQAARSSADYTFESAYGPKATPDAKQAVAILEKYPASVVAAVLINISRQ